MISLVQQPVLVGVAQLRANRGRTVEAAREPRDLIAEAVRRAAQDTGVPERVLAAVDRIDVVNVLSWAYEDLPGDIAAAVGATPREGAHSEVGGNQPVQLVDAAAARIAAGENDVVVVCGGEASASLKAFATAGRKPDWSPGGYVRFSRNIAGSQVAARHGLSWPTRAYPLYENGLRAALGQSLAASQQWSADIYSDFTRVAATHDAAWNPQVLTPEQVGAVTPENRYICFPYPLQQNAFPAVDQAAAVILASRATALEWGIPEDRLVHVWGGAGGADTEDLLARRSFSRAPAMEAVFDLIFDRAGVQPSDADMVDLYSCFPSVPKIAALHLGLPREARLSVTGGLTAFGGPGNNYSLHAVVCTAERIRAGGRVGFIYGNGELVTKHHAILVGREPHPEGYVSAETPVVVDVPATWVVDRAEGDATLVTYTAQFNRDGTVQFAAVVLDLPDGSRTAAHVLPDDPATLRALLEPDPEPIGRRGTVTPGEVNTFRLDGGEAVSG